MKFEEKYPVHFQEELLEEFFWELPEEFPNAFSQEQEKRKIVQYNS